jgi:hypothetical protein
VVLSDVITAASIGALIGSDPTTSWEVGELVGNGRSGRRHENAGWVLDVFDDTSPEPLDGAVRSLVDALEGRKGGLDAIRANCTLRVRCYGSSDSGQGGFWLSPETVQRLGSLGVEFFCTIYLEQADPEDRPLQLLRGVFCHVAGHR